MTNQSKDAGNRSLRVILQAVIAVFLILSTFAVTALADTLQTYEVTIVDGGVKSTITTNETEPIEILTKAGISLADDDKVNASQLQRGEGGTIVINRLSTIKVEYDGNIRSYNVYGATVEEALKELGIELDADTSVNCSLTAPIKDAMVIRVFKNATVKLTADDKTKKYKNVKGTVADLINFAGIELDEHDYTEPSLDTALTDGMKVLVCRVEYKVKKKTESVKYTTVKKKDKKLAKGVTATVTKGVTGKKTVTYNVKYVNGEVDSKEVLSQKTKKKATSKIVKVGTKKVKGASKIKSNGVDSKNGYKVGQVIDGRYTHYCACATCNGNSRGVTSSGKKIRNGMENPYYIACNWLPLGSVIEVDGVCYTVVDRGGSNLSKKGRIDIFTPEGHSACYKYGTGSCKITIQRLGW